MRKLFPIGLIVLVCMTVSGIRANAPQENKEPLKLIQTISMPNVKGRIDHMEVDLKGRRLFVAGLENNTVEVVDLKSGKWIRSVPGTEGLRLPASLAAPFWEAMPDEVRDVRLRAELAL